MKTGNTAYPTAGINKYVMHYLSSLNPAPGGIALDIPSGDGRASAVLHDRDMEVLAYDLFPDTFHAEGLHCHYADLSQRLPLGSEAVDVIVCQEGLEHVPNHLAVLEEFNRVLKPGGSLILTTPNRSHLRARVARLLVGSELIKRLPPSEVDSIWWAEHSSNLYWGHLFLLDVNQLWVLSRLTGFDIAQTRKTELSKSAVVLGVFLAPLLIGCMLFAYYRSSKKNNPRGNPAVQEILWRQVKINLSPKALFCKHIFWILTKRDSLDDCRKQFQQYARNSATVK